jgi:aspartokinase/homoserine dehydrogenase 1
MDVARKALILARELGLSVELSDVVVEPLVPAAMFTDESVPSFLTRLESIDAAFADRVGALGREGKVLRYLCRVDPGDAQRPVRITVGPVEVPLSHPAATLRGSEAMVAFTTERYQAYPLIVRGAGAGGAVTAAGVLADVLAVAQTLRGR